MKTVLGISLLVIGLIIGVAGGFLLSTGNVVSSNSKTITSTDISVVPSLVTVTLTTTVQSLASSENPLTTQNTAASETTLSSIVQTTHVASSYESNVTISGPVSAGFGANPYKVIFSGAVQEYSFPVSGGAFSGSIPNGTYTAIIFYTDSAGIDTSCNIAQPVIVESSVSIYPVSLSC